MEYNNDCDSDYEYQSSLESDEELEPCEEVGSDVDDMEYSALDHVLVHETIQQKVVKILAACTCSSNCVEDSQQKVAIFLQNLDNMDKEQSRLCLMTSLAMLRTMASDKAKRKRFAYQLPIVGIVCRDVYATAYGISARTLMRLLKSIDSGLFYSSANGLLENNNAAKIDMQWLIKWFKGFAKVVGEVVPLRVRKQCTNGDVVTRYVSHTEVVSVSKMQHLEKLSYFHEYLSV
jgi:hypothetical protein